MSIKFKIHAKPRVEAEKNFVQFESFKKAGVKHCFTTKHGGVSTGFYESMNMGFNRGDEKENVKQNYNLACEFMGICPDRLAYTSQTHGKKIRVVSEADFENGYTLKNCDGIMTNTPGITLVSLYADCVPLFFYDLVKRVAALAHAGWRGTLLEIGALTVKKMVKEFKSKPSDILAAVGPSIGKCCFEVDGDVAFGFYNTGKFNDLIENKGNGKYMIDLWGINRRSLEAVMPSGNIEISGICTKCNADRFFSHREMGENRGCMAAFISADERR